MNLRIELDVKSEPEKNPKNRIDHRAELLSYNFVRTSSGSVTWGIPRAAMCAEEGSFSTKIHAATNHPVCLLHSRQAN